MIFDYNKTFQLYNYAITRFANFLHVKRKAPQENLSELKEDFICNLINHTQFLQQHKIHAYAYVLSMYFRKSATFKLEQLLYRSFVAKKGEEDSTCLRSLCHYL